MYLKHNVAFLLFSVTSGCALWSKLNISIYGAVSLLLTWKNNTYVLQCVLDLIRCGDDVCVNHGNDSVIIHFTCLRLLFICTVKTCPRLLIWAVTSLDLRFSLNEHLPNISSTLWVNFKNSLLLLSLTSKGLGLARSWNCSSVSCPLTFERLKMGSCL